MKTFGTLCYALGIVVAIVGTAGFLMIIIIIGIQIWRNLKKNKDDKKDEDK